VRLPLPAPSDVLALLPRADDIVTRAHALIDRAAPAVAQAAPMVPQVVSTASRVVQQVADVLTPERMAAVDALISRFDMRR
jgi:hypothetical protein